MQEPLLKISLKEIQLVDRIAYDHKINLKQIKGNGNIYNFYIQQFNNFTDVQSTK